MLVAALAAVLLAPPAAHAETLFDGTSLKGWRHAGGAPLRMLARLRGHHARYAPELAFAA